MTDRPDDLSRIVHGSPYDDEILMDDCKALVVCATHGVIAYCDVYVFGRERAHDVIVGHYAAQHAMQWLDRRAAMQTAAKELPAGEDL